MGQLTDVGWILHGIAHARQERAADRHVGATGMAINADGKALDGHTYEDCRPIRSNSVSGFVQWGDKAALPEGDAPMQIELSLRDAHLYGFTFTR